MFLKNKCFFVVCSLALVFLLVGPALAKSKGQVELAYVEWSSELASVNVMRAILEKLGYEVELTPVSVGFMYMAVANGDVTGTLASWQPIQRSNLKAMGNKLVNLGPNMVGVQSGLVVPSYVTIDSIDELNANADKFDNEIIGIDSGSGVMQQTENAISEYGVDDLELVESTGAMMTAALKDRLRQNKWCVVTGWTPHWMWGVWDLKYLKDPKQIYGSVDDGQIVTLVRKGLKEDMPEVYSVMDKFLWAPEEMAEVMVWIKNGMDPKDAGRKFIEKYPERYAEWTDQ
ncbi:glycine betaine ABC transporter substrate-binding protein [Maridesulfovibrio sp.]|uniref:glycine betaine ABC transporter substrate-binding protein n=1 Tax=Maridesulfovibrio sp. TaxID=2795000 RepID=UPI0029CA1000|nr:glycine betaine ABC transporter substrate-binding protein [Maridesulfovibrio sp.]